MYLILLYLRRLSVLVRTVLSVISNSKSNLIFFIFYTINHFSNVCIADKRTVLPPPLLRINSSTLTRPDSAALWATVNPLASFVLSRFGSFSYRRWNSSRFPLEAALKRYSESLISHLLSQELQRALASISKYKLSYGCHDSLTMLQCRRSKLNQRVSLCQK